MWLIGLVMLLAAGCGTSWPSTEPLNSVSILRSACTGDRHFPAGAPYTGAAPHPIVVFASPPGNGLVQDAVVNPAVIYGPPSSPVPGFTAVAATQAQLVACESRSEEGSTGSICLFDNGTSAALYDASFTLVVREVRTGREVGRVALARGDDAGCEATGVRPAVDEDEPRVYRRSSDLQLIEALAPFVHSDQREHVDAPAVREPAIARVCDPDRSADDLASAFPDAEPVDGRVPRPVAIVETFRERPVRASVVGGFGQPVEGWNPGSRRPVQLFACVRAAGARSGRQICSDSVNRPVPGRPGSYVAEVYAAADGRFVGTAALGVVRCTAEGSADLIVPARTTEPTSLDYVDGLVGFVGALPPIEVLRPADVMTYAGAAGLGVVSGGSCVAAGPAVGDGAAQPDLDEVDLRETGERLRFAVGSGGRIEGGVISLSAPDGPARRVVSFTVAAGGYRFDPDATVDAWNGQRRLTVNELVVRSSAGDFTLNGSLTC